MPAITNWYGDLLPVTQYLEITHGIILVGIAAIQLGWSSILPFLALKPGMPADMNFNIHLRGLNRTEWCRRPSISNIKLDSDVAAQEWTNVLPFLLSKSSSLTQLGRNKGAMIDDHAVGMDKGTDDNLIRPFTLKEQLDRMRAFLLRKNTKITHHAI
jgi:hypothetical protein